MEFVRMARNPWGEEVLLGLAWNVLWLVVAAGVLFVIFHAFFARKKDDGGGVAQVDAATAASIPPKVERHSKSARISHWILAAATFTLLITAFVPILGLQFAWVTIHWIAGLVFGAYLVYHTLDTLVRPSWGKMLWIGPKEIGQAIGRTKDFFGRTSSPAGKPGKWGTENKVFHHVTALAGIAVLGTGLLMMLRVDTWFWAANPYALAITDATWGWVYVLHGVASVGFVGLLIAHIYFAVRPDKWYLTKSMVRGWITKDDYLDHYSPERWPVSEASSPGAATQDRAAAGAGASSESVGS
jgi:formate dehydrogenase subunit gamma